MRKGAGKRGGGGGSEGRSDDPSVEVSAPTSEAARRAGAERLGLPPDRVEVVALGAKRFRVRSMDLDARVVAEAGADGKVGLIASIRPARGRGLPLTVALARGALGAAGVVHGIDDAMLERLVEGVLRTGRPRERVQVARATAPQHGRDGAVELLVEEGSEVEEGKSVARLVPPTPGTPGADVRGVAIPAHPGRPARLEAGEGVRGDADVLVAERDGVLVREGVRLEVRPFVFVTEDGMEASLWIPAGTRLDPDRIARALAVAGVVHGIDSPAVIEAGAASISGEAVDRVVASGTLPVDGEDGRYDFRVPPGLRPGTVTSDGRMDYHERGFGEYRVEAGETVADRVEPGQGTPGSDVLGRVSVARPGRPATMRVGEGIRIEPETGALVAEREGLVVLASGRVSVVPMDLIDGDVDYTTGNIRLQTRGVRVTRDVRSGFVVDADLAIIIDGVVEDARVLSKDVVRVGGGIVQSGSGLVRGTLGVECTHASGARIHSDGDLVAPAGLVDCEVEVRGRVICDGKRGRIAGGRIVACGGVMAETVGSEDGGRTEFHVGEGALDLLALEASLARLEAQIAPLRGRFGEFLGGTARGGDLSEEDLKLRETYRELLRERDRTRARFEALRDRYAAQGGDVAVRVRGVMQPGAVISFWGTGLDVLEAVSRVAYVYDRAHRQVVARPYEEVAAGDGV